MHLRLGGGDTRDAGDEAGHVVDVEPLTMFAGMPGSPLAGVVFGYLIWIPTTLRIVLAG